MYFGTNSNYREYGNVYSSILKKDYWIASRCIATPPNANYSGFALFKVNNNNLNNGTLSAKSLYYSHNVETNMRSKFFPIVFLNANLITSDGNNFKVDL